MSKMYRVWWPYQGQERDDGLAVKAWDAEDAATKWANWYDYHSNDYSIVGGTAAEVLVAEGDGEPVAVTVRGEMTRSYRARTLPPTAQETGRGA